MMQKQVSLLSFILLALLSCEKEEIMSGPLPLPADRINFVDPQAGQRSYYRLAEINLRAESGRQITYTGDTLIVEITGMIGDTFQLEERFTEGSPNRDSVSTRYCDTIRYGLLVGEGAVSPVRSFDCHFSFLFEGFRNSLPLLPGTDARAELDGWQVLPFDDGNDDLLLNGYVEDFRLFGVHYPRLLVQVDPSLEPLDGNRRTWLYSDEAGIVRSVIFNGFAGRGIITELWAGPE